MHDKDLTILVESMNETKRKCLIRNCFSNTVIVGCMYFDEPAFVRRYRLY